jgi:hypothetical protein
VATVLGLVIPADRGEPVTLAVLGLTASRLSDAIGGGLLEDALCAVCDGSGYTFYLDEQRVAKGLPRNERAAVLSARLGHVGRAWLAGLCGDVLVLGCDERLDDADVPPSVVDAATRCGLDVQPVREAR